MEPSFISRTSQLTFDNSAVEVSDVVLRARGTEDSTLRVSQRLGVPIVEREYEGVLQLYVPPGHGLRELVLAEAHTAPYGGHFGTRKTVEIVRKRFWWPQLRATVKSYCDTCLTCKQTKDPTTKPPGQLQPLPIPAGRFQSWSLDFVTDLPPVRGNNTILVIVDRLTKYVVLIPCTMSDNKLTAAKVAKLFMEHIVSRFGIPRDLIHDRDPRFTAAFWQELWSLLGTRTLASTAYHP